MPNQDDPNQNNNNQTTGTTPVIFPQADLPPLPPDFSALGGSASGGQDVQTAPEPPVTTTTTTTTTSVAPDTTQAGSAAPSDLPPMVVSSPKKKFGGGKIIATILGVLLLVGGVGTGIYLTGQNQNPNERADTIDCTPDDKGNADPRCSHCDILKACGSTCVGEYTSDCQGPQDVEFIARCDNVKAYSPTWVLLSIDDLSKLKAGDQVNFCATGYTNFPALPFTAARFTINGVLRPETTAKRPGGDKNEFCDLYTIPPGVTTFTVSAEVKRLRTWR